MDDQQCLEMEAPDLLRGMAFLSENPEAFGFVADAYPVATDRWLVAAGGQNIPGRAAPTYSVSDGSVEGLFDHLYGSLVQRSRVNHEILERTFGDYAGPREHSIARYVAALAEMVAMQVLTQTAGGSFDGVLRLLGYELSFALDSLCTTISDGEPGSRDSALYAASLGICRITDNGGGFYTLDAMATGDFEVFLLDAEGMRPLRLPKVGVLRPGVSDTPLGRRVRIAHPSPFAVLLLSRSAGELTAAERRSVQDNPGIIWRYRMRLEEMILRIVDACKQADQFGDYAARAFAGRARGRDSASGAVLFVMGNSTFDAFRTACHDRLVRLEELVSLLPDGYDPASVAPQEPRAEIERAYIRRLLSEERALLVRTSEALQNLTMRMLSEPSSDLPDEMAKIPDDVPEYHRLTVECVQEAYRLYNMENEADRALLTANRRALRDHFSDNWITLRPFLQAVLLSNAPVAEDMPSQAQEEEHDHSAYIHCRTLNADLGRRLDARKAVLGRLETLLADSLTVLRAEGNDWLHVRASDECPEAWAHDLVSALAPALHDLLGGQDGQNGHRAENDRYRSLLAAYMSERDVLFVHDTTGDGFFAASWEAILNGSLSETLWEAFATAISRDMPEDAPALDEGARSSYAELVQTLRRISLGTGALQARIEDRAAERRTARDLAGRPDLQMAAIRASAYRDTAWGEEVCALLDTAHRNNYMAVVRRWQEARELMQRRAAAYEEYVAMYADEMAGKD